MSRELKFRVWLGKRFWFFDLSTGFNNENKDVCSEPEQFTGLCDKNGKEIFESDYVNYYTTFHKSESAVDLFGVEPQMEFDAGSEFHRKYTGVIKFFPSTGFILANVKIYECVSEGEYAHQIENSEWDYISKQSTKIMSCTKERCKIIGSIHTTPELLK